MISIHLQSDDLPLMETQIFGNICKEKMLQAKLQVYIAFIDFDSHNWHCRSRSKLEAQKCHYAKFGIFPNSSLTLCREFFLQGKVLQKIMILFSMFYLCRHVISFGRVKK